MKKVVIVGGGWSGISAAITARNAGASVLVLERTDMLLGTGLVGGIMRNNGRFTATEEAIALGGGEVFEVVEKNLRHKCMEFPGHKHADLYDIATIEPAFQELLNSKGIEFRLESRVKDVKVADGSITAVVLDSNEEISGDVYIDTTGSAGPQNNCTKYGNGCAMCVLRCPTYGGRVSVAGKAGVEEKMGEKADGTIGAMSGSCKLLKESLSAEIVEMLNKTGCAVIPLPEDQKKDESSLISKACQQYALKEFAENIILLDTGHAKLMGPYFPLAALRQVPGFKNARYEDPYSGNIGNSMRYMALAPRDNALKVIGLENLFCGGEKAGLLVGHTEAIVTGLLAGHNAVRWALGLELLILPNELAIGDAIAHVNEQMKTKEGMGLKYTFSGSVYFDRMVALGLYTTDVEAIKGRVEKANLTGVYAKSLM